MSNIVKTIAALGVVAGLGVAALPLSSYAVETGPVTVRAEIDNSISVTSASNEVNLGTLIVNGPVSEGSVDVTVATNDSKGYTLTVKDADSVTDMVNSASATSKIPAGVPAQGKSFWGVKGGTQGAYTPVTAAGVELAKTTASTGTTTTEDGTLVNGEITKVTFGVSAGTGLEAGTYEDDVVFTATVNTGA